MSGGTILVVRHGRTAANAGGLLLGRHDPSLDEQGRAQARALAAAIVAPDLVLSSPLARARETAAAFGRPVVVDERWIELDYGDWDGRPIGEVSAQEWSTWRADPAFCPPGGESLVALTTRVHGALDDLAADLDGRTAVVVSHVSPVKAALAWALGVGPEVAWRCFVAPAAVATIALGPGGPSLHGFNDVAHLAGGGDDRR